MTEQLCIETGTRSRRMGNMRSGTFGPSRHGLSNGAWHMSIHFVETHVYTCIYTHLLMGYPRCIGAVPPKDTPYRMVTFMSPRTS